MSFVHEVVAMQFVDAEMHVCKLERWELSLELSNEVLAGHRAPRVVEDVTDPALHVVPVGHTHPDEPRPNRQK